MVDGVAEHPEGGPEALLLGGGEVAEADGGFDEGGAVGGWGEGCLGFETARAPFAGGVFAGDELDGGTAGELDVLVGGGVGLEFVVGVGAEGLLVWLMEN